MPNAEERVAIRGSERGTPLHGARSLGPVPTDERFEVTVRLRRKSALPTGAFHDQLPSKRTYLSREQYAESYGADPADIAKVEAFARGYRLAVVEASAARRSVFLSGTAADFSRAFGTTLEHFEHDGGTYRGRVGTLTVPADLDGIIEGIFGLDDRPAAAPHFQRCTHPPALGARPFAAAAKSFTPPALAQLYRFPATDAPGQCIALIELGGGYRTADLRTYFQKLGMPTPTVKTVRIDGGKNQPTTADGADGEVMLDIEVAAAVAPKAVIAVYFAPNTDKGFLDAITAAIHDTTNKPTVISISWGSAETNWTQQALTSFNDAFQSAGALGVTICCAAGDNGSGDGVSDGRAHVDFPASSPYVLACGGTKLTTSGNAIAAEVVWNESTQSATGGGISDVFPLPSYQTSANVPKSANPDGRIGRGVPDVAGDADPATGYEVRVDGQDLVIGGTSAVAPLWAGLIALINRQLRHPVGFLNPLLYASSSNNRSFRDITSGTNGAYRSRSGWDPCTGWGSPDGAALLKALSG